MKKIHIALMTAVFMLTACTEDLHVGSYVQGEGITFAPCIQDEAEDSLLTRAIAVQNETEPVLIDNSETTPLYLHTEVTPRRSEATVTRGAMLNYISELRTLGSFGVSGYRYDPTVSESVSDVNANFMYNAQVTWLSEGEEWKTTQPYYIPGTNDRLTFYAYSPYTATVGTGSVTNITGDDAIEKGPMVIGFTVNDDVEQQVDFMTAYAVDQKFAPTAGVPLRFTHALTAIRFVLSDEVSSDWNIKNISIDNAINHANYKIGAGWQSGGETRSSFLLDLTKTYTNGKPLNSEDKTLTTNAQTFLMIPQSFSDDDDQQCFTITLYNPTANRTKTLRHSLKGTTWTAGTVVTYSISTSSVNMVTPNIVWPTNWDGEKVLTEEGYVNEEEVGIYAVDISTKEVAIKNVPVKYNVSTGKWYTEEDDELRFKSNYDYYAYYPYKSTLTTVRNADGATYSGNADATVFFADVISGWTPSTGNQNTRDLFCANDLQVGMGVADDDGLFGHLKFPMQHTMGLAIIELESKTITATVRYFADDNNMATSASYDIPNLEMVVTATPKLSGGEPYITRNKCYYVVKNSTTTQLNSVSGEYNSWTAPVNITISGIGKKGEGLAQLPTIPDNKYIFRGRYFTCTQAPQTYALPTSGTYRMDCWGAGGGNSYRVYTGTAPVGGKGGYTSGSITLGTGSYPNIYVYVGYGGVTGDAAAAVTFNGGGGGCSGGESTTNTRGGGATDFRLVSGAWNNAIGLRSRIIVAAGGSGAENYGTTSGHTWNAQPTGNGGAAGGLIGYGGSTSHDTKVHSISNMNTYKTEAGGGTQTSGGARWFLAAAGDPNHRMPSNGENCVPGAFGYGGSASSVVYVQTGNRYVCGGGGGYYGGASGSIIGYAVASGGGGSSFISGHAGCDAIKDATGEVHTGQPNHYSGCIFMNTEMIDGQGYKWTTTKGSQVNMLPPNNSTTKIAGNSGAGYARIATPIVIGEQ